MQPRTKKMIEKVEAKIGFILVALGLALMIFGFTHLTNA